MMNTIFDPTKLARAEIQALKPYASARALADSSGILLNANENPFAPAVDSDLALNRYPDPQPAKLKNRLAEIYGVDPERLLITRGSDEGIDLLMRVFCRPGKDSILICPPCFGMYALSARVQGAEVVESRLIEHEGEFVLNSNLAEQAKTCRISFLCSPNNPTGNVLPYAEVEAFCQQQLEDHQLVVVDEAYIEFAPETSLLALQKTLPNLIILRTLSKAFALAGCRIGVVIAEPEIISLLRRIIAPYPLPTPTVALAMQALTDSAVATQQQQIAVLADEKQTLLNVLHQHPSVLQVWPGAANFILIRASDGPGLVAQAAAAGIRLRDQSAQAGLEHAVRITIGRPEENLKLIEFLQRWS